MEFCCISATAGAADLQPLDDTALSDVQGRDGVAFTINLTDNIVSATYGTTDSSGNPASLNFYNLATTGLMSGTMDVTSGGSGKPSIVNLAFPTIGGANNLQIDFNMGLTANGSTFNTGVNVQNLAFSGSNLQLTTGANDGAVFGLGLNLAIGNVLVQPNGLGNTSGQMALSGITVGAMGSTGTSPWAIANVATQPGILNVITDSSGGSVQLGIGWPTVPGAAPTGSVQIGNISFTTPTGNVSLGSSGIGGIQIQYLNVKLRSS